MTKMSLRILKAAASRAYRIVGFNREIAVELPWASGKYPFYYVVRRSIGWGGNGFFSNVFYALSHIAYAEKNGWIPVVDMRNYHTCYSERVPVNGSFNDWEHYFIQAVKTRDAYRSGRFILSDALHSRCGYYPFRESDEDVAIIPERAEILRQTMKTHLRIREEILEDFRMWEREHFAGRRVLGIHWRGTDKRNPPPGHRPTPSISNMLNCVRATFQQANPDLVFLASDESGIKERVESSVPVPVVVADAYRLPQNSGQGLHTETKKGGRPLHHYLLGLEVLRDAWLLSRCDSLVHGHSNVSNAAMLMRTTPFTVRNLVKPIPGI